MNEKNWLKPLLFSIFGLLLVAGLICGAYILGQKGFRVEVVKKTETTPAPELTPATEATPALKAMTSPTLDPTTDWETYTNTQYGYRFKHPRGWTFTAKAVGDETKPLYVIRQTVESNDIDDYLISIKAWSNPDRKNLINWLQFMKDSNALALPAEDMELVANSTVGGESAMRFWSDPISRGEEPGRCFQACPVLSVYFVHNDKAYSIQHVYLREVDDTSRSLFGQILATLQFL